METEAVDLVQDGGKVSGVRALNKDVAFEICADLVVGADGRHSTIREKAGLPVRDLGAPIDVLWFRLSRKDDRERQSFGYLDDGKMMVLLDRNDYWQCAYIIPKGAFDALKTRGLDAFRRDIVAVAPLVAPAVAELKDWDQVKLLSVTVDRLQTWYRARLLCIGDSAHAMSPVGGVGINLAIQDAVAAANVLVPAFREGIPTVAHFAKIQNRRMLPTRLTQGMQILAHRRVLTPVLQRKGRIRSPWILRLLNYVPPLRWIPARAIGIGFRPEHVQVNF